MQTETKQPTARAGRIQGSIPWLSAGMGWIVSSSLEMDGWTKSPRQQTQSLNILA